MGRRTQATVQSVQTRPGGDYVLEAVTAGATVVPFEDASDFDPDGGQALVNGTLLDYTGVDLEDDTVTLAEPLPVDLDVTDFVAVEPPTETVVAVTVGDLGEVTVEVPHALKSMLPEGERDSESAEVVLLEEVGVGAYRIVDVVGAAPAIIAGDPVGERVQITRDGLRVFVESPNQMGEPYELVSLTNGRVSVGVMAEDGTLVGGISRDGTVTGSSGSFSDGLNSHGIPVVGTLAGEDAGWMDRLPRGIIAYNGRSKDLSASTEVERRYLNVTATLYPGRRYRVAATIRAVQGGSNGAVYVRIKHAPGSSRPLMTDPYLGPTELASATGTSSVNMRVTPTYEGFITVSSVEAHSFVSTFAGYYGAAPTAQSGHIYVEDVGPAVAETGGIDDGTGDGTILYTTTWTASAARRYNKTGALISSSGSIDQWYWHGSPTDFQAAAILFGDGATESDNTSEVGKTIQSALGSGATVRSVTVTVRNKVFYDGSQGVVGFGRLNATSLPSSLLVNSTEQQTTTSGALITRELPTAFFQGGTNTGITFGDKDGIVPGSPFDLSSGAFHGVTDSEPPRLTITYSR